MKKEAKIKGKASTRASSGARARAEGAESNGKSGGREADGVLAARLSAHIDALSAALARVDGKRIAIRLASRLAAVVVSYFVGRAPLPLDTCPLGTALLAAVTGRRYPYVLLGVLLAALGTAREVSRSAVGVIFSFRVTAFSYLFLTLVRIAARLFIDPPEGFSPRTLFGRGRMTALRALPHTLFGENIFLRMASACISAFLVGVYTMRTGGYRYYDLFSAMLAMLAAPTLTFVFSCIESETETRVGRALKGLSELGFSSALALSLGGLSLLGANAGAIFVFFTVLYISRRRNALLAAFVGLCAGLAIGARYAPAFLLCAPTAYVLRERSEYATCGVSLTLTLLASLYFGGASAAAFILPPFLVASVLFIFASTGALFPARRLARETERAADIESAILPLEARMGRLGESFAALSASLYKISERMKSPGNAQTGAICARALDRFCSCCVRRDECLGRGAPERSELVSLLSEQLARRGRIDASELARDDPSGLAESCLCLSDVICEANTELAELACEGIRGEKTELFALDYDAVSRILKETIEDLRRDNEPDREMSERLSQRMSEAAGIDEIAVIGMGETGDKRIVSGDIGARARRMGERELRGMLEDACGFPLNNLVYDIKNGSVTLSTSAARRFEVDVGFCSLPSGEDPDGICGDTVRAFEVDGDRFYLLISDGMGTGQTASNASEICGVFIESMLSGGNRKSMSLKMLNTLLRAGGSETSATIDLAELDLVTGRATFVKSGAVASFVKRGDRIFKLRSGTAPIGIMKNIDAEQTCFDIEGGDIIIMMSDGVSQMPEENASLMAMLGESVSESEPSELARAIAGSALAAGSRDDISAAVLRVSERKGEERMEN